MDATFCSGTLRHFSAAKLDVSAAVMLIAAALLRLSTTRSRRYMAAGDKE
jgi:hypothetical protein